MTTRLISSAAALALLGALAAPAARAAPDHWVQAFVDARGNGTTLQQDSGQVAGPSVTSGPIGFHVADAFGSFDSDILGGAAYGHLWGWADAAQTSPFFARQSDANADSVAFQDRLTLVSNTLAPGTAVDLSVTMVLTDQLSGGPTTCCANVAVNGHGGFVFALGDQAGLGQSIQHRIVQTKPLVWFVGTPTDVGAILFFDVGSSPGVNSSTGSSRVDLADVVFYLTLPAGVSLVSASGASYAAPVPEPSSAALLAAGIAGLLWRRRREGR